MKVLIATVTAGAGHLQAAAALDETWHLMRPADTVEKLDLLTLVPKLQRTLYAESYLKVVAHAPELWGFLFSKTDNPTLMRRLNRFRRAFAKATNPRFARKLRDFAPDVVVCTHFLPAEVLGYAKKDGQGPMAVAVVTDFEAHALWMDPSIDLYCVATPETKARLVARGAGADQVEVTGIPVAPRFRTEPNLPELRRTLGVRDDIPVLLVLGGGFGMGPVAEVLLALNEVQTPIQVIVVAGRNLELRRELATLEHRHPTRVLGFVNNMHEWMAVSELVLTKPGGLTTSEALALGRPLLIYNPIPGQESANSDYLLERGAAAKINRVEDLPYRLTQLLADGSIQKMSGAARALGRPDAAQKICESIVRRLKS